MVKQVGLAEDVVKQVGMAEEVVKQVGAWRRRWLNK